MPTTSNATGVRAVAHMAATTSAVAATGLAALRTQAASSPRLGFQPISTVNGRETDLLSPSLAEMNSFLSGRVAAELQLNGRRFTDDTTGRSVNRWQPP